MVRMLWERVAWPVRVLAGIGLAAAVVFGAPAASFAHDAVERTLPANGTTTNVLPASVSITMSEEPVPVGTQVVVTGPSGAVSDGVPTIDARTVTQKILASAPGGDYRVTYRITSSDGHPLSGEFSFHARIGRDGSTATASALAPATTTEDPAVTSAKQSQLVPVLLSVAGTAILAVLALVLWRVSVRRQADRTQRTH